MDTVRIGVIGVGGMGSNHARYLLDGKINRCELVAVCDIDGEKLKPFDTVKQYADSGELIRSGEVDAVLIATPHYDHTLIGMDALEQGLHVLVEKPISVHKADCEKLIAAHTDKKLKFSAMFQMRTYPQFNKIRQLITDGELGEIQRTSWVVSAWFRTEAYYASGGWRATWKGEGGGVLMNQCPHNLDQFQWLCGMPEKVRAFCGFGKYHDIEVEDEVTAYLEYSNGATGIFTASTGEAPGTDRLEIAGDRGRLTLENGAITFERTEKSVTDFRSTCPNGFDKPDTWRCEIPAGKSPEGTEGHAVITQNIVDAILDDKELIAPAEEGIHSVELANAMLYSAWTDSTVSMPLDSAVYEAALKEKIEKSTFVKKASEGGSTDLSGSFR